MKIQTLLTLHVSEIDLELNGLKDVFEQNEYIFECRYSDLIKFRTTDKSKITYILYNTEYDGNVNVNLVDMLEIEL